MYPAAKKRSKTARVHEPRWNSILAAYKQLRDVVISNRRLMDNTGLQLFDLNTRTLTQWFVVISQYCFIPLNMSVLRSMELLTN